MWDVVVVGAGPGGCQTAWHLHRSGCRVLLVDRHDFPRHKSCGGMLSAPAARLLPFDVARVARGVSHFIVQRHADGSYAATPNKAILTDRTEFDTFFWRFVQDAGCRFWKIPSISRVKFREHHCDIFLSNGEFIRAAHIVAADGANSLLRRLACPDDSVVLGMALETDIPLKAEVGLCPVGFDFSVVEDGYAWYFPKGDRLNVGLYSYRSGKLDRVLFGEIIRRFGQVAQTARVHGAPLALFDREPRLAAGRMLFVGDAAGLVDPFSGEGILEALDSGRACAMALTENRVDPASAYLRRLAPLLAMLRQRKVVAASHYGKAAIGLPDDGMFGDT